MGVKPIATYTTVILAKIAALSHDPIVESAPPFIRARADTVFAFVVDPSYLFLWKLTSPTIRRNLLPWALAVFDWDGTLVDSAHWTHRAMQAVFRHYSVEAPTLETFLHEISSDFMLFYQKYGIPASATRKDLNAIWEQYLMEHPEGLMLREGAQEALTLCRNMGVKTGIVSGTAPAVITHGMERLGIAALVDQIRGNACGKVNELRQVLAHFRLKPYQAVFIDDAYEGINAAKNVGMTAVAITGGFDATDRLRSASPDHVIGTLREFPTLLKRNSIGAD
jgi:phosphoglycolate phosphatase